MYLIIKVQSFFRFTEITVHPSGVKNLKVLLVKPDRVIYIHFFMLILKIKFLICVFHSELKFFFTRSPPCDQILILTKKSKLGIPKMSKNCLQNFWFWHWPNLSDYVWFGPSFGVVSIFSPSFVFLLANLCTLSYVKIWIILGKIWEKIWP